MYSKTSVGLMILNSYARRFILFDFQNKFFLLPHIIVTYDIVKTQKGSKVMTDTLRIRTQLLGRIQNSCPSETQDCTYQPGQR